MATRAELDKLCRLAQELGIPEVKAIDPRTVVTAEWVRLKCQYGCGGYNKRLTCPPYSPTPATTRKMLDEYRHALLLHGDGHAKVREIAVELERRIFLEGYYKAFAFACGPCWLCEKCNVGGPCKHPYQARPAMEASGIDVFATVRGHGFPIQVVTSRDCQQNHYALVLVE